MSKLTPKESTRAFCTQCLGMKQLNTDQVRDCEGDHLKCSFFPYRLGKRPSVKIHRKYCITDCMNGYKELVTNCTTVDCPNYLYRFGSNPARKGLGASKEILRKARESRNKRQESTFSCRLV